MSPFPLATGCSAQPKPQGSAQVNTWNAGAVSERLRFIATDGKLAKLNWSDFAEYRERVQRLYEMGNFQPVWLRNGQVTPQSLAMITALESSRQEGLNPEDYDASRWPARLSVLKTSYKDTDSVSNFDAALTVSAMRYISDLHTGRVNPKHVEFNINIKQTKCDLPQFVAQEILSSNNVAEALKTTEPQYYGYQRTEAALATYLLLAAADHSAPLLPAAKAPSPGETYSELDSLADRLRIRGDLPQGALYDAHSRVYEGALVEAVKRFQVRHGIAADGKLGTETLRQLNMPLSVRVTQLEDALERWRWLPQDFATLPVAVNIPEFVLRVFTPDHRIALRMNVVVGKAFGHQTPVFAQEMKYIIFRPYWNIPPSIARAEIVPALQRNGDYLHKKHMEITDPSGRVITSGAVSADELAQLRSGRLMVRQKPGADNSLGLVKLIFPNQYNVYLHSTPAPQLFSQSRRDFSHGCIRVQEPAELAAFLLRGQPKWTLASVKAAMESGPDNQQVNLLKPVPVVIVYLTAVVEESGEVYFFDDIYGLDRSLNAALAEGRSHAQ